MKTSHKSDELENFKKGGPTNRVPTATSACGLYQDTI